MALIQIRLFEKVARNNANFVLDLGDKFVFKDGVTTTYFASGCGAGKLVIPDSVINIPNSTFSGMTKLKEIVFEHPSTSTITLPTPGSSTEAFYTFTALNTTK